MDKSFIVNVAEAQATVGDDEPSVGHSRATL
jgi:hypothetical protein